MHFLRHSIRNKLIALLFVATILPIGVSMYITYAYTKESLKNKSVDQSSQLLNQGKANLLNYTDTIVRSTLSVYSDTALYNVMDQSLSDYESESKIYSGLQNMARNVKETYQVHLDVTGSNRSYLFIQNNFKKITTNRQSQNVSATPYKVYMETTHPSHDYGIHQLPYYPSEPVITIHRPVHRVPSVDLIGFLSMDVKLDVFRRVSEQLIDAGKEQLYILDAGGTPVLMTGRLAEQQETAGGESWVRHLQEITGEQGSFEWNEAAFAGIVIYNRLNTPYMNWTLVKLIQFDKLYESARRITVINVLVATGFLFIALAATVAVSIRLTSPIKQLIRQVNAIQAGKLDVRVEMDREDEIGHLSRRFQTMMGTINDLILREYKLELANKTNQLKVLQAQVNPHFINNALQSIGTLALQHQAPKVYALLASLAKMMHYSMHTRESIVPLAKELEHLNYYLELQKQRFDDNLIYKYVIGEGTSSIPVPKMILQPIAENYFKHGYGHVPHHRIVVLTVTTELQHDRLYVQISDNGTGIPDDQLRQLQLRLEVGGDEQDRTEHIGLSNVMDRLRLYYGNQASMRLLHAQPQGLSVVMTIPTFIEGDFA